MGTEKTNAFLSEQESMLSKMSHNAWSWGLQNLILPVGDCLARQGMIRHLQYIKNAQWWSRDEVLRYQVKALQNLIEIAYREVPFYRASMDELGLKPHHIKCLEDLQKLPILTKEMIRKNYPSKMIRLTGSKTCEVSSSGSTGTNLYVREDIETTGRLRACHLLALDWAGWSIGDPHLQFGMTLKRGFLKTLKDFVLRCHYVSSYELTNAELDRTIVRLEKNKIEHIHGYPGSLYHLARRTLELKKHFVMKSVVSWGDNLYSHYRNTIQEAFQRKVFDTYGCGEGVAVGAQCGVENRYHTHSTDVIVEFVNDEGMPVGLHDVGNLILTRLHPGSMPLIRYQVGDLGIRGDETPCPCGRGFLTMESIQGRDTDVIITPGGNRLIVHFFTGLLEHFPQIAQFQIRQKNQNLMIIYIVPSHNFSDGVGEKIIKTLKEKGADISMKIQLVGEIPSLPSGKRRFVINEVAH
jgi:phenylacetate-CoA ligase